MFDTSDLRRIAISTICALLVSATCIVATVAPAGAASATMTAIRY